MHPLTNKLYNLLLSTKVSKESINLVVNTYMKERAEWLKRQVMTFDTFDDMVDQAFQIEEESLEKVLYGMGWDDITPMEVARVAKEYFIKNPHKLKE